MVSHAAGSGAAGVGYPVFRTRYTPTLVGMTAIFHQGLQTFLFEQPLQITLFDAPESEQTAQACDKAC